MERVRLETDNADRSVFVQELLLSSAVADFDFDAVADSLTSSWKELTDLLPGVIADGEDDTIPSDTPESEKTGAELRCAASDVPAGCPPTSSEHASDDGSATHTAATTPMKEPTMDGHGALTNSCAAVDHSDRLRESHSL